MSKKMKAQVLYGVNDLRYVDCDIPALGPDDVLVKVSACGICGSDIPRILDIGTYHFPTICGHEFGGVVVKVGSHCDEAVLNKRVAVIPLIPDHQCEMCEIGLFAQCKDYNFLGSRDDGGFAEFCRVPKDNLVFMPDGVDDEVAAMLEPMTVAQHVITNNGIHYGDDVVVYGLGAIGIFIAQWAKAFGAAHVFAIDLNREKVEIAKKIGLNDALCSTDQDVKNSIEQKTNGKGVDAVFEASGSEYVFNEAIRLLKQSGRMGLVGRPAKGLEIANETYEKILRSEITIKGTWSFEMKHFPHNAWDLSLQAVRDGKIKVNEIISHRLPLSKLDNGIRIMADQSDFFYKILVKPELDKQEI